MSRATRSAANRAAHALARSADIDARRAVRESERLERIAAWRAQRTPIAAPMVPATPVDVAPLPKRRSCSEARRKGGLRAAETRAESDDAVRANISPSLIPAFETWKRSKLNPNFRGSRTEQFEQWVHDHAVDAEQAYYRACELDADAMPDESEADYTARQQQSNAA